ncbi:MAG: ABC transporter substrate-binding protein [Deltaproteobacteria bacterium]|nr:ABC transporter substrate-binding protein [Deltaproteobacteria bacterium]
MRAKSGLPLLIVVLLAVGDLLLTPLLAHPQEGQRQITISYPALTYAMLPLFAAQEWQILARNGLQARPLQMGSRLAAAALLKGDIHYVAGVGPGSVGGTLSGIPSRAVWFASNQLAYSLLVRPGIKSLAELRSKRIAVTGLGGTADVALRLALAAAGENPRDFVIMGFPLGQLYSSLEAGVVDAALMDAPFSFYAEKKGFREVLEVGSHVRMPLGGLTTLLSTIQTRPDEVKRVIRSMQEAKDELTRSRERGVRLIAAVLKVDVETAGKTHALFERTLASNGVPTREGMENIVRALQAQKLFVGRKVAFEEIADDRLTREVARDLGYKAE